MIVNFVSWWKQCNLCFARQLFESNMKVNLPHFILLCQYQGSLSTHFTLLFAALRTLLSGSSLLPYPTLVVHHVVLHLSDMLDHWFPTVGRTFWPTSAMSYHFWTLNKYVVILCQTLLRTHLIMLQPVFRNHCHNYWSTHGTRWHILNGFTYMLIKYEGTWFIKASQFILKHLKFL